MLSRARNPMKVWLLQAFPRELFTRGPPTGPHVLLRKLRGELNLKDVDTEIARLEAHKSKANTVLHPTKKLYRCTHCLLSGRTPFMKPAIAFGARSPAEIAQYINSKGAWTRCLACQAQQVATCGTTGDHERTKPIRQVPVFKRILKDKATHQTCSR